MRTNFLLLALLIPLIGETQSFFNLRRHRNLTVFAGSGTAAYFGELTNPGQLNKPRYSFVAGSEFFFLPRFSLRTEAIWFRIAGDDAIANDDRKVRNLSFFANNKEFNAVATVNLVPLPSRFDLRSYFNVYGFAGIGLLVMNPKTKYDGKTYALQPIQTEGVKYSRFQPAFPVGFGIRFTYKMAASIVAEGGYRFLKTDYLDDVSGIIKDPSKPTKGSFPDPASLSSDIARALADRSNGEALVRGNPSFNDGYFLFNIKLEYYLEHAFDPFHKDKLKVIRAIDKAPKKR